VRRLEFISDPWFYALAVPAVLIVGFSKAGVGGGLGIMAVPLMALIVPPVQAAAVLMPLLLFMDVFSLRAYWGIFHRRNLMILLPGSLIGVAVGGLTFGYMNDDMIRILIGAIAILFTLYRWVGLRLLKRAADHRAPPNRATGTFWAGVGGFTSVVAHGGSPPVHIYLLPQRLDKRVFIGTTVILFALVDVMKLVPYALLGTLDKTNLTTALILAPLAPVGIWLGVTFQQRLPEDLFYRVCYTLIFLTGCRLVWQGAAGLLAG
jgi:uncharacterized membrane protein YfcA